MNGNSDEATATVFIVFAVSFAIGIILMILYLLISHLVVGIRNKYNNKTK